MTRQGWDQLVEDAARAEARRHPGVVIGAVDAVSGQRTVLGRGRTRRPDGPAPGADTLFEIGSITKVFTGLLLAVAAVRGEVTVDTPVGALLPGVAIPDRGGVAITLEQLSTHRSGLPRSPVGLRAELRTGVLGGRNPYADLTTERVLDLLARTPLRRTPGTGPIAYSNLGSGLLGIALVRAAGADSYADLVQSRICAPLGLADTTVLEHADPRRLATGHRSRRRPVDHWTLTGLAGAGALLSSGADLLTFLSAQLRPESTPLAAAIRLSQQPRHTERRYGIALGWITTTSRTGLRLLWHNGGTGGFRSFAGLRPDRGTGVVVLANSRRAPEPAGLRLLTRL